MCSWQFEGAGVHWHAFPAHTTHVCTHAVPKFSKLNSNRRLHVQREIHVSIESSRLTFLSQQAWVAAFYRELGITFTIGRGKTPNVKHPLRNQDMVTRKCLAPNSSIYWITANIPGSGTLTKPRLGLTSVPNQHRRKPLCSFSVPFIHQALRWETECLFEVILYSELLHGSTFAFSSQHAESVQENNEEHHFSPLCYNNRKLLVWM